MWDGQIDGVSVLSLHTGISNHVNVVNMNVIVKAPRQLCLTATYYRKENVKTNVVQFVHPF